jgi:hypothetical protein
MGHQLYSPLIIVCEPLSVVFGLLAAEISLTIRRRATNGPLERYSLRGPPTTRWQKGRRTARGIVGGLPAMHYRPAGVYLCLLGTFAVAASRLPRYVQFFFFFKSSSSELKLVEWKEIWFYNVQWYLLCLWSSTYGGLYFFCNSAINIKLWTPI